MEKTAFTKTGQMLRATPSIQANIYHGINEDPKQCQYFRGIISEEGELCKLLSHTAAESPTFANNTEEDHPEAPAADSIIICYPAQHISSEALEAWHEGTLLFIDKNLYILHPTEEGLADGSKGDAVSENNDVPTDIVALLENLQSGSALERIIPDFKSREEQLEMLEAVGNAFNKHELCVVEAGTGTGKSFAYLFAALQYVRQNNKRVVITTATITLQQQLIEKDIPIVQKALSTNIPVTLVKGKRNYLCSRRLFDYMATLFADDIDREALLRWADQTESGDRSELPVFVPDTIWDEISSDNDTCFLHKCKNRDRCFIRKARERAMKTRLLVTNHHLLFSDLSIRSQSGAPSDVALILPPVHHIIFDEAHMLEERITAMFSASSSVPQIQRLIRSLSSTKHGIVEWFETYGVKKRLDKELGQLKKKLEDLERESINYFSADNPPLLLPGWKQQHGEFAECIQKISASMESFISVLQSFYTKYSEEESDDSRRDAILGKLLKQFTSSRAVLHAIVAEEWDAQLVYWLERVGNTVRFCLSPLHVAPIMQSTVLENYETIVFCSASLRVGNSFDFWADALGLKTRKGKYLALPSPFMHQSQLCCLVPTDAPNPNDPQYQDYLSNLIHQSIQASGGGALVLFTSYKSMHESYLTVEKKLSKDITPLIQGTDDRHHLLQKFRDDENSVLFATDSFWAGVDVPGASLRLLILCRLPFQHPSDPIRKARHVSIESGGGNPFMMHTLPVAVLRFKQGFGRLIRSEKDSGAVVIADARIESKYYGRIFRESIPDCSYICCNTNEIAGKLQRLFDE